MKSRILRFGVLLFGIAALAIFFPGHENSSSRGKTSMPEDWSHHHVVFSNPATREQTLRVQSDPRFWHQWYRRNVPRAAPSSRPMSDEFARNDDNSTRTDRDRFRQSLHRHKRPPRLPDELKRDWAVSLGPNGTVGAGNYPAKFSFDITTANCGDAAQPDFVVFNTSVQGANDQASIVAYDNLYTGCGGTVPTTYWSYNTGGTVLTSVALSLDGSQIAFVQTSAAAPVANLVLLKWKPTTDAATSTTPDSIPIVSAAQYPTFPAPCMVLLPFTGGNNDTNSSPFYDYSNDALYVGDDNGALHKFQPVFTSGIPAEVGSPTSWPVSLATGSKLSSPVYDSGTRRVFVGNDSGGEFGGRLFSVMGATGNLFQTSPQLATGDGILSGPLIDSTAELVYVFAGTDTGNGLCGGTPCSGVYQFSTFFISGGGTEVAVSSGGVTPGFPIYLGTFDNEYFTSSNATGHLYVCGQSPRGGAQLFKLSIVSGSFGFQNNGPFSSSVPPLPIPCSPITEVFNPSLNSGVDSGGPEGTDMIFLSTQGTDTQNSCDRLGNGGCLWGLPVTSWQPGTTYQVGQVILDDGRGMCLQIVTTGGSSNPTTAPNWGVNPGVATMDGTVTWTGKMCFSDVNPPQPWVANIGFGAGFSVLDPNGNIEAATNNGTTGATQPRWPLTIGALTLDGGEIWVNVGPINVSALPVFGGTSGFVVDNTVLPGALAGASQIYFSPLATGFGTCGAGNGCAVQASQAGLN